VQVIQDFEGGFIALFRLLDCFCFGSFLLRVGQVTFSGRYCFRCGFELFSLYKFAETVARRSRPLTKSSEYQKP
jgi:hypothetical protein